MTYTYTTLKNDLLRDVCHNIPVITSHPETRRKWQLLQLGLSQIIQYFIQHKSERTSGSLFSCKLYAIYKAVPKYPKVIQIICARKKIFTVKEVYKYSVQTKTKQSEIFSSAIF